MEVQGRYCGQGRALARTFLLEIARLTFVADTRACPRVLSLMYPSRTRALLSILWIDDSAEVVPPECRSLRGFVAVSAGRTAVGREPQAK